MIKVVIDTNVVVSANLVDEGPSAGILSLAILKKISMYVSPAVLAEYEEVLRRPRLKIHPDKIANFLADIYDCAEVVNPRIALRISKDETDNRFYECAEAAQADYLITGNTDDFPRDLGPTRIITPRRFLQLSADEFAKTGG